MKLRIVKQWSLRRRVSSLFLAFAVCLHTVVAPGADMSGAVSQHLVAGVNRPTSVPDGYLITPFGYFHPSCVQSLNVGENLLADGRVQHADGSVAAAVAVCNYPRYTPTGLLLSTPATISGRPPILNGGGVVLPEVNGWLENANVSTGSATKSYGAIVSTWTVPVQPAADDGQVLFFFPGLEDIDDSETSILQPVLAWSSKQWTITSWNCCLSGVVTSSPSVKVAPGDRIFGSVTSTCAAKTLSCKTWNVLSVDLTTGKSTILANTPSDAQIFNWAFGGVAEPYYVVSCKDFPSGEGLTFTAITLFDENLDPVVKPAWTPAVDSAATPACDYGIKDTATSVTLEF